MSLMSMRHKMASTKTATYILWALILVFCVGIALWSVPSGKLRTNDTSQGATNVIATINGTNVTAADLNDEFYGKGENSQARNFTLSNAITARSQAFDNLVDRTVLSQTADKLHVNPSYFSLRNLAGELAKLQLSQLHTSAKAQAKSQFDAAKTEQQKKAVKSEDATYKEAIANSLRGAGYTDSGTPTEKDFIKFFVNKFMSKDVETGGAYEALLSYARTRFIGEKIARSLPVSPFTEDYAKYLATQDIKASWIFIAAKTEDRKGLQTAEKEANDVRAGILKDPTSFTETAKTKSNDYMTSMQGGSLGWISGDNDQVSSVALYMAYACKKDEIFPVMLLQVASQYAPPQIGYAFVRVEDVRESAAAKGLKWDNEKDLWMIRAKDHAAYGLGRAYVSYCKTIAQIVRKTNELKYFQAQKTNDFETMKRLSQLLLNDTKIPDVEAAAFKYQAYQTESDPQKKIRYLEDCLRFADQEQYPQLQLELGRLYAGDKQIDKAVEQFDAAATFDTNYKLHEDLKVEYTKLGKADKVKAMTDWLATHPKDQNPYGTMGGGMPINVQ